MAASRTISAVHDAPEPDGRPGRPVGLPAEDVAAAVSTACGRPMRLGRWQATRLDVAGTAISTEAVVKVTGRANGGSGELPWALLVKVLRSARHWPLLPMVPESVRQEFVENFQWRVEADALGSELPGRLPSGLRTPRVYRIQELGDDRVALWLEYIDTADGGWDATATCARPGSSDAGPAATPPRPPPQQAASPHPAGRPAPACG